MPCHGLSLLVLLGHATDEAKERPKRNSRNYGRMVQDDQLSCRVFQRSSRELIQIDVRLSAFTGIETAPEIDGLANQPLCLAVPGEIRPDESCLASVVANRAHHVVPSSSVTPADDHPSARARKFETGRPADS